MRKTAALAVSGAVVAGAIAGAALFRPSNSSAGNPSPAAATQPDQSGRPDWGPHGPDGDHPHGPDGDHPHGPDGRMGPGPHLDAAAKALGVSTDALVTSLRSGETMADVAKAQGVEVQAVVDALVKDESAELAGAVKDGHLTQAQADEMLAHAEERFTAMVNGEMPPGPPMDGPHGPHGPDGRMGPHGPSGDQDGTGADRTAARA